MKQKRCLTSPMLFEIQRSFEDWRKQNGKEEPIGEDLWQAAIKLSANYSLDQISKALKVNYHELERRVSNQYACNDEGSIATPSFLELALPVSASCFQFSLEISRPDGTSMKLNFAGDMAVNMASELLRSYHGGAQ